MAKGSAASNLALLRSRLEQAGAGFHRLKGARALAGLLRDQPGPLWLEDHPWLREAAGELERLGGAGPFVGPDWAPEAHTAVTVGLGAVPETGSVLVPSGAGPSSWLPYRAARHLVLVPWQMAGLSMAEALELSRGGAAMVTWLTGPTRTADIEKVLVLGAQGPEVLEVVIYQPEA
jgi:L-lactate dehydrogenase complex protein LldG